MKNIVVCALLLAGIASPLHAEESAPDAKTTTEQFGDWQLACNQVGEQERCRISQQLSNQQGQVVSVVNVFKDANDQRVIELALPLMVDLVSQVKIAVDEAEAQIYPYNLCNGQACFSLINRAELIEEFKNGNNAVVSFRPVSVQDPVKLGYSLRGFSRALQALDSK